MKLGLLIFSAGAIWGVLISNEADSSLKDLFMSAVVMLSGAIIILEFSRAPPKHFIGTHSALPTPGLQIQKNPACKFANPAYAPMPLNAHRY